MAATAVADLTSVTSGVTAWITWYGPESCDDPDCVMASGARTYPGAAACGYAWALGTRLLIRETGQVVTCEDRGGGPYYWVDVWGGWYTGSSVVEPIQ